MKSAIEQLTEAARKVREATGENHCSAVLMVTSHTVLGPEKIDVQFCTHAAGAVASKSAPTLAEAVAKIIYSFTPAGLKTKAERMEQEAASLRKAAAKMEGKQ